MRCSAIFCLFWSMSLGLAYSQSSATITMDHGEVTAGDPVNMVVTFDRPATCTQIARVYMEGDNQGLDLRGSLEAGKDTTTLSVTVGCPIFCTSEIVSVARKVS